MGDPIYQDRKVLSPGHQSSGHRTGKDPTGGTSASFPSLPVLVPPGLTYAQRLPHNQGGRTTIHKCTAVRGVIQPPA